MHRAPFALAVCLLLSPRLAMSDEARPTGLWNIAELNGEPKFEFGAADDNVREVYYENVPYRGKPTRVFGYYAVPKHGLAPFPAMLCVHGGGGKAFREWAELWAERGYVALAMDLAGKGPDGKPLPDGGPDQTDEFKFGDFTPDTARDMWTYQAVAAVLRGHSLLAFRKEVDRHRIGVTGISWGGYLTCIVAGIDDRVQCAIPVYGCGFLGDNSAWVERLGKMSDAQRKLWLDTFDPSVYLRHATCPMLFVNGTNDFAYPLDSYQKSYRLPKGPVTLCVRVGMKHGHQPGWEPKEIGIFADSVLKAGEPLPKIEDLRIEQNVARVRFGKVSNYAKRYAMLHYAIAQGPWQAREWKSDSVGTDVLVTGSGKREAAAAAVLPTQRPIVVFFTVTDEQGALVSTPHRVLEE